MNKSEFVGSVADEAGLTRTDVERAVDAMIQVIKNALKAGDSVSLMGFGTFAVRQRAARIGRNPQTGEPAQIKAASVPTFKVGKALKDAVN
jgi:DNA-binding protein HU-beta